MTDKDKHIAGCRLLAEAALTDWVRAGDPPQGDWERWELFCGLIHADPHEFARKVTALGSVPEGGILSYPGDENGVQL